jgi:hypothetical protein
MRLENKKGWDSLPKRINPYNNCYPLSVARLNYF